LIPKFIHIDAGIYQEILFTNTGLPIKPGNVDIYIFFDGLPQALTVSQALLVGGT
jgi:hypothetical protein